MRFEPGDEIYISGRRLTGRHVVVIVDEYGLPDLVREPNNGSLVRVWGLPSRYRLCCIEDARRVFMEGARQRKGGP